MAIAPPLFLLGCMRSGTSVAHDLLLRYFPAARDLDPRDFEGRVFWQERGFNIGSPRTGTRCDAYGGAAVTDTRAQEMRAYAERRAGRDRHVVNKNPHLSNKIGLVTAVFPEARILHLVREQRAVVASMKLQLDAIHAGDNAYGFPFVHYWPEEPTLPCWSCVRARSSKAPSPGLARRSRRWLRRWRLPAPPHATADNFRARHPDPTRYYPGDGFRRIPESWLRLNADIIRQVDAAGAQDRYLALNYADLVQRTRETLAAVAAFAGIERTAPGAVPVALDPSRQVKWRHDLTVDEQRGVAAVTAERTADADLIRNRLPGPLFADPG
jgi:hypothetical protein